MVKYDGSVFFDGKPIKLAELGPRLNELKARHGMVWYYRENAEAPDSPPTGLAVISAILSRHLPVQMCLSPDFSEYIGADGKAHRRSQ